MGRGDRDNIARLMKGKTPRRAIGWHQVLQQDPDRDHQEPFQQGQRVVVFGLAKAPQYNGKRGKLEEYDQITGRWAIAMDGDETEFIRALPANILQIQGS